MIEWKRCGRPHQHVSHTWVPHPKSTVDFECDGLTETMTLFDVRTVLAAVCA